MALAFQSEKIMFLIYRDAESTDRHRVCYFTELDEHNKEKEINDAMRGEHIFDGFLRSHGKEEAKRIVGLILDRLNAGESLPPAEIERELKPFMP